MLCCAMPCHAMPVINQIYYVARARLLGKGAVRHVKSRPSISTRPARPAVWAIGRVALRRNASHHIAVSFVISHLIPHHVGLRATLEGGREAILTLT